MQKNICGYLCLKLDKSNKQRDHEETNLFLGVLAHSVYQIITNKITSNLIKLLLE